jgi:hypothetical protein
MWQFAAKVAVTVTIVVAVSEIARRSSFWGAILASLPLTSLLAFVWLYVETGNALSVATLSQSIFWLILPSLPLFIVLPVLLLRLDVLAAPGLGARGHGRCILRDGVGARPSWYSVIGGRQCFSFDPTASAATATFRPTRRTR